MESPIKICLSFHRAMRYTNGSPSFELVHVFPGPRYFPSARLRFFLLGNIYFRPASSSREFHPIRVEENSLAGNRDAIKPARYLRATRATLLLYRREINENFYFFINASPVYSPSSTPTRFHETILHLVNSLFPKDARVPNQFRILAH